MNSLRQVWAVNAYNFRTWRGNPRIAVTFGLAFVLCFLLGRQVGAFSGQFKTTVQLVESFDWTFADGSSILLSSLLLVLLFGDMPFLGPGSPYWVVRMKRRTWLMGQALYVVLATAAYMLFLLLATVALSSANAFTANMWSDTAALLGYSPAGQATALSVAAKTLELSTPYVCMTQIFVLMLLYTLAAAMLMLALNLRRGAAWGITGLFAFNIFGYLVRPETIQALTGWRPGYRANLLAAWVSPLQHATYSMHNFGFDRLPSLWQSWAFFAALALALLFLSLRAVRRYHFNFTGGQG